MFASPDVLLEEAVKCYVKDPLTSDSSVCVRACVSDKFAASLFCHPGEFSQVSSPFLL